MGLFNSSPKRAYDEDYVDEDNWPTAGLSSEVSDPVPLSETTMTKTGTVISEGMTVSGALKGSGVVKIEGSVDGEIDLNGAVIVAATGSVTGPVIANVIRVAGRADGNMTAREHLRLEKTGRIHGDVETSSLVIEDGGCLNGRATMTAKEPEPLPRPTAVSDLQFGPNYTVGEAREAASETST